MRLRTRLYLLVAGTVIPLAGLAVVLGALLVAHERDTFERLARDRARAMMSAVDAQLQGHVTSLMALAALTNLNSGDLRAFHRDASRVLKSQPEWENLILSDASGNEILHALRDYGDELPRDPDLESLARAIREDRPVVGGVTSWQSIGKKGIAVRVPVAGPKGSPRVLSAVIATREFENLIRTQGIPTAWVMSIVDGHSRFVARVPAPATEFASPSLRGAIAGGPEGWFRGRTVEGRDTFTAHLTSARSGWSLGLAVPTELVFASAWRYGLALAFGTLATVSIALALAWWIGRRISMPIAALAAAARGLGERAVPSASPLAEGIEELADVQRALAAADVAMREREALVDRERSALKAADRAKDEFLAMLGHELRNPLSAITTSSHVLRASPSGSRMHAQAQAIIERQARQMTRLVEDLLDISRLTMGKVALHAETFDLAQLAAVLAQTWEQSGRVSPGRIRVQATPAWVEADRARIEQVVANLLDNAHRFTPAGRHLYVRVGREEGRATLQVADEGAGIAPHLLEQVFKPFSQAPQGVDRSHGGLGLGLAVVRRLVEMHGGTVAVASEGEGRGATFTVTLPAVEAPHTSRPRSEPPPIPAATGLRVLVVEDGDDAREMLHAMLTLHGHEVRTAENGAAALAEAERFRPDIVLLDIGLPDIDGYEVARRLRARERGDGARLVALTGYGQSEDEAAAYAAGFDRHMTKPVAPENLARTLAELGRPGAPQPASD